VYSFLAVKDELEDLFHVGAGGSSELWSIYVTVTTIKYYIEAFIITFR
jgi:hypothetical protein